VTTEAYETSIDIEASPDVVFDYFVDPALLVRWMGDFARLEASEGGVFAVDINGMLIRGHFVRVERPHLIEIAWGEPDNDAMPPGSTRVVVRLTEIDGGTRVALTHTGLVPSERAKHAIGWAHFFGRLCVAGAGGDPGADPWAKR
jgi:uncharacterized protein YndB with AHSA1/START domain